MSPADEPRRVAMTHAREIRGASLFDARYQLQRGVWQRWVAWLPNVIHGVALGACGGEECLVVRSAGVWDGA